MRPHDVIESIFIITSVFFLPSKSKIVAERIPPTGDTNAFIEADGRIYFKYWFITLNIFYPWISPNQLICSSVNPSSLLNDSMTTAGYPDYDDFAIRKF